MSEPRKKDLIEDRVRFQHGYVMGLAHRSDRKITDDDRRILERVAASLGFRGVAVRAASRAIP